MDSQKSVQNKPSEQTGQDEAAIRAVIQNLQDSTARKDTKGVLECFADGNVMYLLNPPLENVTTDKSGSTEGLQAWFDSWKSNLKYFSREMNISCAGDVGFAYGLTYMAGERTNGEKTDLWFRETFGLRKIEGDWKITHQHQSVPMKMDGSQKAAIDLKPVSH